MGLLLLDEGVLEASVEVSFLLDANGRFGLVKTTDRVFLLVSKFFLITHFEKGLI